MPHQKKSQRVSIYDAHFSNVSKSVITSYHATLNILKYLKNLIDYGGLASNFELIKKDLQQLSEIDKDKEIPLIDDLVQKEYTLNVHDK